MGEIPSDFQPRQIFIVHRAIWLGMQHWAKTHGFHLARVPDGADEDGRPFLAEDRPEAVCERCGHTPTYGFMPKDMP